MILGRNVDGYLSHLGYVNEGVQAVRELYIVCIDSVVSGYRAGGEHAARARPVRVPPRRQTHARPARANFIYTRPAHHSTCVRTNFVYNTNKTNDVSLHVPLLPLVFSRDLPWFPYAGRVRPRVSVPVAVDV